MAEGRRQAMPLGPVMLDVAGLELAVEEREVLRHPLVGGVILFARNYASPQQLHALTASIHALRDPALLVAVDHEGGRVQRFRDGFTVLPAMRSLGMLYEREPALARRLAHATGVVLAAELLACGVDFSFTPVLDLDYGRSEVIGGRAFHALPAIVGELAGALADGLGDAGVAAVGKHFPGHGYAEADSHHAVPVDERAFADIDAMDLAPYRALIARGLAGVMPAHVIYPRVDALPAGFSRVWIERVLRQRLGFDGLVFSDDLSMEGAGVAGDIVARGRAALGAGCDMVLVCNDSPSAAQLLEGLGRVAMDQRRAAAMRSRTRPEIDRVYAAASVMLTAAIGDGTLA